jgi:hypothetical protein
VTARGYVVMDRHAPQFGRIFLRDAFPRACLWLYAIDSSRLGTIVHDVQMFLRRTFPLARL